MGKILTVDLSKGTVTEFAVPDGLYEAVLGGVGLAVSLLSEMIPAGAKPLGPDNVLGFMSGLLTGSGSMMTGRWMAVCKSPLTGGWGDANCGGTLSPAIKQCGYDGIFFMGRAEKPVAFIVDEAGLRLVDATGLWGKDAVETEEAIKAAWTGKKKPAVAAIGPAAEKLSLISGISNDGGRYAARSGVGAVMGSKNLKAMALSGSQRISCADPAGVKELSRRYTAAVQKLKLPGFVKGSFMPLLGKALGMKMVFPVDGMLSAAILRKWGTIYNNTAGVVNGDSPLSNWAGSVADYGRDKYRQLNPDRIVGRETKKYHCYSCVIGCGGVCDTTGLGTAANHTHKPEYETVCAFGGLVGNDNLDAIFLCNDLCNRAGLDTISAGSTIAFAIECYERGAIGADDTGGLVLRKGDPECVVKLLRLMIARQGIGDILADGVARAAARIGGGTENYAIHSGGQEPGMHDSRFDPMMGVSYSADPTPGRHTISASVYYNVERLWEKVPDLPKCARPYPKSEEYEASAREARKSVAGACFKQLLDAAGGCLFAATTGLDAWPLFEYLNLATGLVMSPAEYMAIGRRIQTMRQAFNLRHGIDPARFIMHDRMAGLPPLESGPLRGKAVPIRDMVREYWRAIGWDPETGAPEAEVMEAMGIGKVAALAAEALTSGRAVAPATATTAIS